MYIEVKSKSKKPSWSPVQESFIKWLGERDALLQPGLKAEPTIKILIFLALLEAETAFSYEEIREIFKQKKVIQGHIPDNTLRTSVLSLAKTLDKSQHRLQINSYRGRFQLIQRKQFVDVNTSSTDLTVLVLDPPAVKAEEVAKILIQKAVLTLPGLYFLEWSARWWETYSGKEAEVRVSYETQSLEQLKIKKRLCLDKPNQIIGFVGLAPGEGLAEIGILKKLLHESHAVIHYIAIDSSQKLLRDHIGLLKETLPQEIEEGRLRCAGVVADIFTDLDKAITRARNEFYARGLIKDPHEFLPQTANLLVTYFGNCLGNNHQDQEIEFFSMIRSTFQNRPLEILVGVSVMRSSPDQYIRNWDDFLLQTPIHLLETKKILVSSRPAESKESPEFTLQDSTKPERCPPVNPEKYIVRHKIEGQIYRFYYRLAYDLDIAKSQHFQTTALPKGTLLLLHSIIKYNMVTLKNGIEKSGLFKVEYDPNYHQVVDTPNGKREYAVFSAYLTKTA